MYADYSDILDRIPEPPKWWYRGVPRFNDFDPHAMSVYANDAALVRICCQGCDRIFLYGVESFGSDRTMFQRIRDDHFHEYGDAPFHLASDGYRCTGETMSAMAMELVEAWRKDPVKCDYTRVREFEGVVVLKPFEG